MSLDLDPIFHTESMVRILREQGSNLQAMELAEKILIQSPDNQAIRQILEELKAEARQAFERFRKTKDQGPETRDQGPSFAKATEGEVQELPAETPDTRHQTGDGEAEIMEAPVINTKSKIFRLSNLLKRVQDYRQRQNQHEG